MTDDANAAGRAASLAAPDGVDAAIVELLSLGLGKGAFDAVLVPLRVPANDSYMYVLVKDPAHLARAVPVPPIVTVTGAKAVRNLTRSGSEGITIAAVMHPCEAQAVIELAKISQADIDHIVLVTYDCPGALPLKDFSKDPEGSLRVFEAARKAWDDGPMRPASKTCEKATSPVGDIHVGILGVEGGNVLVIPRNSRGEALLSTMGMETGAPVDGWSAAAKEALARKTAAREAAHAEMLARTKGLENIMGVLKDCINCHNCQRVCPICYCKQCYFDSPSMRTDATDHLDRAGRSGSLRLPCDMLLFHLGRMSHMVLSCVSCGACEDACPMDVPVSQLFSMVGHEVQRAFDYVPGRSLGEARPLATYQLKELTEVED